MIKKIVEYLTNKKILILGFGMEGISTYKFIRKYLNNQKLYIADGNNEVFEKNNFVKQDENVELITQGYLENLEQYDIIMKTPGISFAQIDTTNFKHKIKSQVELLLEFTDCLTIGVTGTKGKSTTSSLIYQILIEQQKQAYLLGNIGVPIFDFIEKIEPNTILVLELSSHQLEFVSVSPKISILLNIFEEHLDHYKSLQGYIDAKTNIYKFQKENDYFLYNPDNTMLAEAVKTSEINSKLVEISYDNEVQNNETAIVKKDNYIMRNGMKLYDCRSQRKLLGNHNLNNAMFALAVSEILELDLNKTVNTINNFEPLPHRMEFVGKFNGILYYNDSIATIPEATMNTVKTLKNVDSLIIGGMDRKVDFKEFIKFLNTVCIKNLICLPTTGHIIADKINNSAINVYKVENMEQAVDIAKKNTEKDKICLLSPAASSYGFYKNFQERGNKFKELVMK